MALYDRPGLRLKYTLGTAGGRAMTTAQLRTFAVAGTSIWELFGDGSKIQRSAALINDGTTVSICNGQTQILLVSAGHAYVYDLGTNLLTEVTASITTGTVLQVAYSDGFFLALAQETSTNKIYASGLQDATSWNPVAFTGISVFPDRAIGIFVDHRELWVFGPKAIQPYFDAGDFPFAFDAIQGGFIESGIAASFSVAKCDNSIMWLESDDRGNCIARRANGYTPVRISNHAIEYEWSTYSTVADAVAYSMKMFGHEFYILTFPTAEKTWVFDTSTRSWCEWGFWNSTSGIFTRHRGQFHTFNFGMHLVLDPTTGAVYEQRADEYTDFGNELRRVRRAKHLTKEQNWTVFPPLQVDLETGLGPNPPLQGSATPTSFYFKSPNNSVWQMELDDFGLVLSTSGFNTTTPTSLIMSDPTALSSWQFGVDNLGNITLTQVTYHSTYPAAIPMVTNSGNNNWVMTVQDLGGGTATIITTFVSIVPRGPRLMLRYSNDNGRTFFEREPADCGQGGEYTKRVIWRRLGRARDRVYELSASDPVPFRIAEAYMQDEQ